MPHISKKIWRQMDERKLRRATDQALQGGHHRHVLSDRWAHRSEQPPLLDAPSNGKRRKKGCKKSKSGKHVAVYQPPRQIGYRKDARGNEVPYYGYRTGCHVCEKCGKWLWGRMLDKAERTPITTRPFPTDHEDHWDDTNISLRLQGYPCCCRACNPR